MTDHAPGAVGAFIARQRWTLGIGALVVALIAGSVLWNHVRTDRLLRADPDRIPADARLMAFAVSHGRHGFEVHCASCHGVEGHGDSTRGVPDLTDDDWLYGAGHVSDIETVVQYGIRAPHPKTWKLATMPAFAQPLPYAPEPQLASLSPGDIDDVTAFLLRSENRPADAQAAERGGAIFRGRGGCYDCHATDARGDSGVGAPNLTDAVWLYGAGKPSEIRDSIAYGRAGQCPAWAGRLKPATIRQIALFVYALSADRKPFPGALPHHG